MNVRNPLIAYLRWFESQDVEWADSIAFEFFCSLQSLKKTSSLLKTSKEEYDNLMEKDYEARQSPDYVWSKEDLGTYEDLFDGEMSEDLKDYLGKFIQLDDHRLVQPIAHFLFLATEVTFLDFKPVVDCAEVARNRQIKSLLLGDNEKADKFEKEIDETLRSRVEKKQVKDSWAQFKKDDFNLSTIHDYVVGDILD